MPEQGALTKETQPSLLTMGGLHLHGVVEAAPKGHNVVQHPLELHPGAVAPGGGRYATVGGADAVFVLDRSTTSALMVSITE